MALLLSCGNCGGIEVYPGLDTVQCFDCGAVTRNDGQVRRAGQRFTLTIHDKHMEAVRERRGDDVPVEG
jgi:hypothetical protein